VLLNCFFSAMENEQFEYNVVKVAVLEERGKNYLVKRMPISPSTEFRNG
jgi:hypothetical protein